VSRLELNARVSVTTGPAFRERVISFGKPQIDKAIFAEAQTRMMSD
jgi:hypothetical protein